MKNPNKITKTNRPAVLTLQNAEKYTGIHYTLNHTGKMAGMMSLSSDTMLNERCRRNAQIPGSICEKCFARRLMKHRGESFENCFARNFERLTTELIPLDDWPLVNANIFRIESFGEVANKLHARNYLNFILRNPQTVFAWWTKNPDIVQDAIEEMGYKPANLILIASSLMVNNPRVRPKYFDHVFTVYTSDYANEHGVKINCGARSCLTCRRCYDLNNTEVYINELVK